MHLLPVEDREVISYLEEIRDRLDRLGYLKRKRTEGGEVLTAAFGEYSLKIDRNFCKKYVDFKLDKGKEHLVEVFISVSMQLVPEVYIKPLYFLDVPELVEELKNFLQKLEVKNYTEEGNLL